MKRLLIFTVSFVIGLFTLTVNADTLVASPTYTAPNCVWQDAGYSPGYVYTYRFSCGGEYIAHKFNYVYYQTCYVTPSVHEDYEVYNNGCGSYSIYKKD